jgi:hypothetical protein
MSEHVQQPRKFGLSVGGVLLLFAGIAAWRSHPTLAAVLAVPAAALVLGGLVAPAALVPVERRWMAAAAVLGAFNTRILLTVAYYLVITPVGLILRVAGRDPLDRRLHSGPSYWTRRPPEPPASRERYARLS